MQKPALLVVAAACLFTASTALSSPPAGAAPIKTRHVTVGRHIHHRTLIRRAKPGVQPTAHAPVVKGIAPVKAPKPASISPTTVRGIKSRPPIVAAPPARN